MRLFANVTLFAVGAGLLVGAGASGGPPQTGNRKGGILGCERNLAACSRDVATCTSELVQCRADQVVLPGDGRGNGPALAYRDNGDGTVTDLNTKLTWEKKVPDGGGVVSCDPENAPPGPLHGVDTLCSVRGHIHFLNDRCNNDVNVDCTSGGDADCAGVGGKCGFAGHRDWYLPDIKKLQTLVDYTNGIDAVFGARGRTYLSSTTGGFFLCSRWVVTFAPASDFPINQPTIRVDEDACNHAHHVLAVRGP